MDNVSFLIRCKNEDRWIGHAIQSAIDFFPNCEIVVINNNSTDDSMDIVKMFETWNDVSIIEIDNYSPGKSLNVAAKYAKYENLIVLSSHCSIKKFDYEIFNKLKEYSAIFGDQIPIYRGKKINKRYIWSHFVNEETENMFSKIENRHFLHNAFCLYTRQTLLDFPFDEKLFGKEDRYWARDIVEKGKKYLYTPDISCEHYWTPNGATWKGIG